MPWSAKRPCREPGCHAVSDGTYCERHRVARARQQEQARGSAAARGYDTHWRRARLLFLRAHPLCAACLEHGNLTPATVVDHITPHRGDQELFWDESNWQPMCKPCHDRKTASEDGGLGNPIKR